MHVPTDGEPESAAHFPNPFVVSLSNHDHGSIDGAAVRGSGRPT